MNQDGARKTLIRPLTVGVASSAVIYGLMIAIHAYCITGLGGWVIAGVELFVTVPLIAFFTVIGSTLFLFSPASRPAALRTLIIAATLVVLFLPAMRVALELRSYGFELAARRAEPLIAAIETYISDTDMPPESLDALIPRYLPSMPKGIPDIGIVTGAVAHEQFEENEWALDSVVSTGIINWDRFIYLPNQRYPDSGWGGGIERIGRWGYVHE